MMKKADGTFLAEDDLLGGAGGNLCAVGQTANGGYLVCATADINNDPTGDLDVVSFAENRIFVTNNNDCVQ